jgi:hypothetical protein
MEDKTEEEFIRHWSGRAYDEAQLAQIKEIEAHLIRYAMHGWRSMTISPPEDELLLCACEDGLGLMRLTPLGDWRTNLGQPHKPPYAWMPAPILPGGEEDFREGRKSDMEDDDGWEIRLIHAEARVKDGKEAIK